MNVNLKISSEISPAHESSKAQIMGAALYTDDIPNVQGTLYAAPILSPNAHGYLKKIDTKKSLAMPGVEGIILARDIPGRPQFASFIGDEPIFPIDKVEYIGQVIGLVVAQTAMQARRAANLVEVTIDPLEPVLTIEKALEEKSYVLPPVFVTRGNTEEALKKSGNILEGKLEVGGQEHFYLEGQVAYAIPQEQNQWLVHTSSQHPGEVQHWIAQALGLDNHSIQIVCRRMGGGFGGKETQAGHVAVWAALAANKMRCPIKLRLDRDEDFKITGKRHPFKYHYKVGFDKKGILNALELMMAVNCGFSADLSGPVADRAIFHTDNAYFLENVSISSYRCKLNTQSHTAFRGFGGPQGMIIIESIIGDIARYLKIDPLEVRMRNLYSDLPTSQASKAYRNITHYDMQVEDNILHPLLTKLAQTSDYKIRLNNLESLNKNSPIIKRGIALTPVKFGISFTATLFNQAGALVHVYLDGSVQVNHGGTEMGQGLHTKVNQIVAHELGVPLNRVLATASDTSKIPNASATAASAGTDLNGRAAQFAARNIRNNLAQFVADLDGCGAGAVRFSHGLVHSPKETRNFDSVVKAAYANRIQLWSDGFYRTPKIHYDKTTLTGRPFYYFTYGAACTEVVIDTLTGESRVIRVDILQDVGQSINPAIDRGQIEGGFIQGLGWLTTEELVWGIDGELKTHAPSTYKIPTAGDIPNHFQVDFWPESNREDNVFGSKAVGEPPFMLAISVYEALKNAISFAKGSDKVVRLQAPATPENIWQSLQN